MPVEPVVLRGETGSVLVRVADASRTTCSWSARAAAARSAARRACRVSRYCLAHATCPVIAVPPSALAQVGRGLRGWAFRHRT